MAQNDNPLTSRSALLEYVRKPSSGGVQSGAPALAQPAYTPSQSTDLLGYVQEKSRDVTTIGGVEDYIANYDKEDDSSGNLLGNAIMRGYYSTGSSLANLFGADEFSKEYEELAKEYPAQYQSFEQDVNGVMDFAGYAAETLAENTASLAMMAVGAAAGTVSAPVAGAVGLGLTATRAATIGATASNFLMQAGESKQSVQAEGGEGNFLQYAPTAVVNTAMDMASFMGIMSRAGLTKIGTEMVEDAAKKSGLERVLSGAKDIGIAAFSEGATEAIQSFNNLMGAKLATAQELGVSEEEAAMLKESFFKGVAGGTGGQVVGSGIAKLANTARGRSVLDAEERANTEETNVTPVQESELPENNAEPEPTPEPVPNVDPEPTPEGEQPTNTDLGNIDPEQDVRLSELQAELDNKIAALEAQATGPYEPATFVETDEGFVGRKPMSNAERPVFNQASERDLAVMTNRGTLGVQLKNWKPEDGTQVLTQRTVAKSFPKEVVTAAEQVMKQMADKYIGRMPVVLTDTTTVDSRAKSAFGVAATMQAPDGTIYQSIGLNWGLIDQVYQMDGEAAAMSTVAHEMGHAISKLSFNNLPKKARQTVYQEYRQWVKDNMSGTIREWLDRSRASASQSLYQQLGDEILDSKMSTVGMDALGGDAQMQYLMSFEEYFAEQVARYHQRKLDFKKDASPELKRFWQRVYDVFWSIKSAFAETVGKKAKDVDKVPQNFETFMEGLALQQKIAALQDYKTLHTVNNELNQSIISEKELSEMRVEFDGILTEHELIAGAALEGDILRQTLARQNVDTGFRKGWTTLLSAPQTIAERFGTMYAKKYMEIAEKFAETKRLGIAESDQAVVEWKKLPGADADRLGKFMFEMSRLSDEQGRRLLPEEMEALEARFEMTPEMKAVRDRIELAFQHTRDRLFSSIFKDYVKPYFSSGERIAQALIENIDNPNTINRIIEEVRERVDNPDSKVASNLRRAVNQYKQLRDKNYFPRARFGRYTLTMRERKLVDKYNDQGLPDGQQLSEVVTHFETFEYEHERNKAQKEMERRFASEAQAGEVSIQASALDDTVRAMYGMPQSVVESLKQKIEAAGDGLSAEQQAALDNAAMELNPGTRFMAHMKKRQNTAGFSKDAQRSFASYIQNASAHLARVEHTDDMVKQLQLMRDDARVSLGSTTDLSDMHSYFNNHMKYILNPENDFAGLKALAFAMFLGYNVKSAVVNLTQLPLVTIPYLMARHGTAKAARTFLGATRDVTAMAGRKELSNPEEARMMQRLYEDGILDDGMYQNLINLANKTQMPETIHRVAPYPSEKLAAGYDMVVNNAGVFFRLTEQYNRRVSALAAFRLARAKGEDYNSAFQHAKDATAQTQFEYGKVNRSEIMRGALGVPFVFMNYMQQFLSMLNAAPLYAAKQAGIYNGQITKEQMKTSLYMTAALLSMGGIMGLPGAEYMVELLNRILRGTGLSNEDLKVTMRRYLKENVVDNPDLVLGGLTSEYGLGPVHLLNLALPDDSPWAVPKVDISGSIGMGNFLPGLQADSISDENELIWGLSGALGGYFRNVWKATSSTDPDNLKQVEKAMPTALKNLSKAARFATRGEETSRGGATFVKFDGEEVGDYTAILFQALGFSPRKLTEKYEADSEKRATAKYWSGKAQSILEEMAYASHIKDKERMKAAQQAIVDFNNQVSKTSYLKPFRITGKMKQQSLRSKARVLRKRELGITTSKKERLLYNEYDALRDNVE
jgi:hypothetical protein